MCSPIPVNSHAPCTAPCNEFVSVAGVKLHVQGSRHPSYWPCYQRRSPHETSRYTPSSPHSAFCCDRRTNLDHVLAWIVQIAASHGPSWPDSVRCETAVRLPAQ